jgi:excisionase family DNA binding protein
VKNQVDDGSDGVATEEREDSGRETVTVEKAGQIVGISRTAAYAAVARGDLPSLRIGRRVVVPRKALDRLLAGE